MTLKHLVRRHLELSTTHIPPAFARDLVQGKAPIEPWARPGVSWVFEVPEDLTGMAESGVPAEFIALMSLAQDLDCNLIIFDPLNTEVDWLPSFE